MKAVVAEKYGGPEVLELIDVPKPIPRKNQILVKILYTSVTAADVRSRAFDVPKGFRIPARLALGIFGPRNSILGGEFAGIVEAVGTEVKNFKIGDRVCASQLPRAGGYAEYACVDAAKIAVKVPSDVNLKEAACLPIGGRTAMYFLRRAGIELSNESCCKDLKVLIYGASGSVGSYALQLATLSGAYTAAVCSSRNAELVTSLGAKKVYAYDSDVFYPDKNYDIVLNTVEKGDPFAFVRDGGVFVDVTAPLKTKNMKEMSRKHDVICICGEGPEKNSKDLITLLDLLRSKKITAVIDKEYELEDIRSAHTFVDSKRKRGNVVIKVQGENS